MTIKILLDPIATARPSKCSTIGHFKRLVENVLATREGVFFYWLLPEFVDDEERKFYPEHPNVQLIPMPHSHDRTREYISMRAELADKLAFNGELWDFDVAITTRAGMATLEKLIALSPRQSGRGWTKQVWIIEEMPLMSWKPSVACIEPFVQDLYTLSGYLAADRVFVLSFHERREAMQRAREIFAPSMVRQLGEKVEECLPVLVDGFEFKKELYQGDRPFRLAYVGHTDSTTSNIRTIFECMEKQWIWRDVGIELLICTRSTLSKIQPPEAVKVTRPDQEEFWRMLRSDVDLVIKMPVEGGASGTLLEPLVLGTPIVLIDAKWTRALVGDDYPFFAKGPSGAYALVKAFYDSYEEMYEQFRQWRTEHFEPLFRERMENNLLYTRVAQAIDEQEQALEATGQTFDRTKDKDVITEILKEGGAEFVLFDVIEELGQKKVLTTLADRAREKNRETRGLVWGVPWNDMRLLIKHCHGYDDASTKVGHLKKKGSL